MWYVKNLPGWERVVRVMGAVVMGSCGWLYRATPVGWILGGFAGVALITAVIGYCPACQIAGRPPRAGSARESAKLQAR